MYLYIYIMLKPKFKDANHVINMIYSPRDGI